MKELNEFTPRLEHCLDPPGKNNSNNNNNNDNNNNNNINYYLYPDISVDNDCILRLNNVISLTEFQRYSLFKTQHICLHSIITVTVENFYICHMKSKKRKLLNYCSMNYEKKI